MQDRDDFKPCVSTQVIDCNDNRDYAESNADVSQHRSKLQILYHAATCPCEQLSYCSGGVLHCSASKRLFAHIITCTEGNDCLVPGCQHSRTVWRHYRNCRRDRNKHLDGNSESSHNRICDICSAVPLPHNGLILCDRFRTASSICQRAGTSSSWYKQSANTSEKKNAKLNSIEFAKDRAPQTMSYHDRYDRIPIWCKRNLLHAQQQQRHQNQISFHKKRKHNSVNLLKCTCS